MEVLEINPHINNRKVNQILSLYKKYMGNDIMDIETLESLKNSTTSSNDRLFYIEDNDNVVAVALTNIDDENIGHLASMVVDENCRGRGYGNALIKHRISVLRNAGCKLIKVTSWRRKKESSYNLMIRNGFVEIKTVKDLWNEHHCVDCHPNNCNCDATFLELNL